MLLMPPFFSLRDLQSYVTKYFYKKTTLPPSLPYIGKLNFLHLFQIEYRFNLSPSDPRPKPLRQSNLPFEKVHYLETHKPIDSMGQRGPVLSERNPWGIAHVVPETTT